MLSDSVSRINVDITAFSLLVVVVMFHGIAKKERIAPIAMAGA
jgi:hypothetical protein